MTTPFLTTQVSLFQPTQISGCTVWLDGADPNGNGTIPANGATVSSWVDKSSNGMTVSAVSSQPTYTTALQNGLGALTFDGTKNLGTGNVLASKFAGNTVNLTMFCLVSFSNTVTGATYASPFNWANAGDVPRIGLTVGNNADGVMMDVGSNVIGRTSFSVPPPSFDNTFFIFSYFKNGSNTQLNLNGSNKATTNNQSTAQFGSSSYAFNVGSAYQNSSYSMRGNVGEILFFNSTLSTQNFQVVEGYLAWKWGLQASLPSTHPYRNTPVYSAPPFPIVPRVPYLSGLTTYAPTSLSNCILWLDGADGTQMFTDTAGTTPITGSGESVKCWKDKSTQANHATNNTNPPTVLFNGQNGRSVLNFSSQYLNLDVNKLPIGSTQFTMFVMFRTTDTATQVFLSWGNTTNAGGFGRAPQLYITNYTLANDFYGAYGITDTTVYNSVYVLNTMTADSVNNGWDNGNVFANNGTSITSLNTGTAFAYIGVGQVNNALYTPFYLVGQIAEIIGYSRVLSTAERQQVEAYLQWKWGRSSTIPSTNPYVITPPYSTVPFPLVPRIPLASNKYFNPTSIAGCVIWFDAADTTQLSITGTTVNTWTSKGSASLTATSVGAGSIVYEKYNGRNALRFNGTNTKMTTGTVASYGASATTWISASVNLTAVTVSTPTDASLVFATSGAPEKSIRYTQTPGSQLYTFNNGSFRDSQNFTNGVRGFIDSAASFTAYVNGANATNSTSAVTYQAGLNQSFIMGQWNTGTLDGYIQEIIVYNSALSLAQYQQAEGYLAWKWGFQGSLPSNHPFKLFPPSP